jgi:3-methyladenine DNA glycosylase AlkC
MADTLKTFFSPALVQRLGASIAQVHPAFPLRPFVETACAGLDALELLDRARHIARALAHHLPPSYPEAADVLLRSLGPEHESDELIGAGMGPFFYLPHVLFVAERGLDHFEISMRAQYELTKRFSAESSIRPYIAHAPDRTFALLRAWAADSNAHVRRLVSEGTRLRLPWAPRVAWLDANPERIIELLDLLKDDPSPMVRRSVANNLNDLGKARPDLLVRTAAAWLEDASADRRHLVEHALRSAVRRGEAAALALLGFGGRPAVALERATFTPRQVRIGGRVVMHLVLRSTARRSQPLLVDVAVHFVKAHGTTAPKVFKLARLTLDRDERTELRTSFSLAVHTTRVPRPGTHRVDIIVNGHRISAGAFHVIPDRSGAPAAAARTGRVRGGRTTTRSGGSPGGDHDLVR